MPSKNELDAFGCTWIGETMLELSLIKDLNGRSSQMAASDAGRACHVCHMVTRSLFATQRPVIASFPSCNVRPCRIRQPRSLAGSA
jgi:hypothetical protein